MDMKSLRSIQYNTVQCTELQCPDILVSCLVSGAPVSQVGATLVENATKFDKSDEVLFKAQDEFLRRLKVLLLFLDLADRF